MSPTLRISFFILLLPGCLYAQAPCSLALHGTVVDRSGKPLPFAAIYVEEIKKGTVGGSDGAFRLDQLCPGTYTMICSFVGYPSDTRIVDLDKDTVQNFTMDDPSTVLQEVEVSSVREDDRVLASQPKIDIKGEELIRIRGLTLGESLTSVTGVYTLQSGPTIFKPVIHGLHSNRILIFNNGIRQEGQQWGSEHAPEIDPFVATKLSVIKGASSIRYGSDAIGGVILVDPASMPEVPGVSGEINLAGASNNGMGVISGILQGGLDRKFKGLSWRAQGTYRRAGNSRTPGYFMENTGFEEANFSSGVSYKRNRFGGEIYYSQFNTRLGIFSGTHAASINDLEAAIQRPEPITPSYFSYKIDRPYQQVRHEMFKANAFYLFRNKSRLDAVFGRQQNERSEYDYVPLSGSQDPELYLRLITHTLDVVYKQNTPGNFSGEFGFSGITQGNVREFQMLIPNFRNYGGGLFYIGRATMKRLTLEGGARYDYRWLRAYTVDEATAQVVTPTWRFQNLTGTIGSQYYIKPDFSWAVNIGTAWRAPSVNELMSQGVHQSGLAYEIGNPDLHSERAYNFSTSFHYHNNRWHGEIGVYENYIDGYIYLKPDLKFIHTVRGSYPTFTYTQVNAIFKGIDLSATVRLVDSLSFTTKLSVLHAWNQTINDYLQLIPANRIESSFFYGFGNRGFMKHLYATASGVYIARQTRVPDNSDYLPPPPGYFLLNASLGFNVRTGRQAMSVSLTASNLLNTAYRDYMDRFRYFTDEPGRNFTVRVRIPFGTIKTN